MSKLDKEIIDLEKNSEYLFYGPYGKPLEQNSDVVSKKRKATKKNSEEPVVENPYKLITAWFDAGNHLDLLLDMKDADKIASLYKVDGLYGVVKKHYPHANESESALLMEFVLHGLAAFSMINKKMIDGKIEFKDLMGSIMNLGNMGFGEDDFNESDYQ